MPDQRLPCRWHWADFPRWLALGAAVLFAGTISDFTRAEPSGSTATLAGDSTPMETIRERYPDGDVKIEREVTTDADGDYVNHGAWRMWDRGGKLVAEGRYDLSRRDGQWGIWIMAPA